MTLTLDKRCGDRPKGWRGSRPLNDVIGEREGTRTCNLSITGTRGIRQPAHETDMMSLAIRTLFWFLIVSAATSLVFEAWQRRSTTQSPPSSSSDDPGDPSPLETYRGSHISVGYRALGSIRTPWDSDDGPGVSAIILNWSRFRNVVLIVSGFCDPILQDVIAEIVVWNNSPRRISAEVSRGTSERPTAFEIYYTYPTLPN